MYVWWTMQPRLREQVSIILLSLFLYSWKIFFPETVLCTIDDQAVKSKLCSFRPIRRIKFRNKLFIWGQKDHDACFLWVSGRELAWQRTTLKGPLPRGETSAEAGWSCPVRCWSWGGCCQGPAEADEAPQSPPEKDSALGISHIWKVSLPIRCPRWWSESYLFSPWTKSPAWSHEGPLC